MANYATTLTISPSNSISPFSFNRRGSIRRGTISSISKDVRVNDVVEIIKQQKKTRVTVEENQLLKRRHSMMNLNVQSKKPLVRKKSSVELTVENQQQIKSKPEPILTHLTKCIACQGENLSTSTDSYSSSSPKQSSSSSLTLPPEEENPDLKQLNRVVQSYSNLLKDMNQQDTLNRSQLEECKNLLNIQYQLLSQLDLHPPFPTHKKKQTSTPVFKSIFSSILPQPSLSHTIQGIFNTIELSYIPHSSSLKAPYQARYSIQLTPLDCKSRFILKPKDEWMKDDKVNTCQDQHCQTQFNWFQRKHHCRRCGDIYCNTHSSNQLPLFESNQPDKPISSRICDSCFYNLLGDQLKPI